MAEEKPYLTGRTYLFKLPKGKDLLEVPAVIGIGGVVRNSRRPVEILKGALYDLRRSECTKPLHPKFYLDERYIYASMGLLSMIDPDLAFDIMTKETKELEATQAKVEELENIQYWNITKEIYFAAQYLQPIQKHSLSV